MISRKNKKMRTKIYLKSEIGLIVITKIIPFIALRSSERVGKNYGTCPHPQASGPYPSVFSVINYNN